jgi:hypothetical protein
MSEKYLIAIQASLTASNYATEAAFISTIDSYMNRATKMVPHSSQKLVVFPEMIGTWLIGTLVPNVDRFTTMDQALIRLIIRNPLRFGYSLLRSVWSQGIFKRKVMEHVKRSIFAMGSAFISDTYFKTFSEAAKKYKCWVVAGSVLLPDIEFNTGSRVFTPPKIINQDKLYNVSFTFDPDGGLVHVTKKVFITEDELFCDRAQVDQISCFDSPFGRVGVLICADCWFPENYVQMKSERADVIVVPAMSSNAKAWNELWNGYSAAKIPCDVDTGLINKPGVTLGHMWQKYGLKDRLNAKWGVVSYLVGKIWDMDAAGESIIVRSDANNNEVVAIAKPTEDTILVQKI